MKIYICNTTIMVVDGLYKMGTLNNTIDYLKNALLTDAEVISAIGHESTAQICSKLLNMDIAPNRITLGAENFNVGDQMLCIKLKSRAPEGKILSTEEIEEIGYEWKLVERLK